MYLPQSYLKKYLEKVELTWEEKIDYQIDNSIQENNIQKISFLKIFKKYISKKFRSLYK